jgi:hypothetical protein
MLENWVLVSRDAFNVAPAAVLRRAALSFSLRSMGILLRHPRLPHNGNAGERENGWIDICGKSIRRIMGTSRIVLRTYWLHALRLTRVEIEQPGGAP